MNRYNVSLVLAGLLAAGCQPETNTDVCKGRKAGDLVITEFMADPDSTDTGAEWIEVFNALGTPLDMKGLQLFVKRPDGTGLKTHTIRAGSAGARGYFVAGDVRTGPNPAHINYAYGTDLGALSNTDGVIGIRCGTLVLDEVTYTKAPKAGRSRAFDGTFDPSGDINNEETTWCDTPATVTYSGTNAGTPGRRNEVCPSVAVAGECLDNGSSRPIRTPGPGDLVITELMANPRLVADTAGEWVEVQARNDVDLNGVAMTWGTSRSTFSSADCLAMTIGSYAIVAKGVDPMANGGLPTPLATFSLALSNSGGTVSFEAADAGIDSATLNSALDGVSWQLDPLKLDGTMNDDPANFCPATVRFGDPDAGDYGTPGLPNTSCPTIPDPNSCIDPGTSQVRPIERPVVGDLVITEFMANPSGADTDKEWFEVLVKRDVDLNNLTLHNEGATGSPVSSQTCLRFAAGSYVVFARNPNPAANGGIADVAGTFTFTLANTGARSVAVMSQGLELDRLVYTATTDGASTQLNAGLTLPTDNDQPANLCATPVGTTYGGSVNDGGVDDAGVPLDGGVTAGDRGTPGLANVTCP